MDHFRSPVINESIVASKDKQKMRNIQTEIKSVISPAKIKYKEKMENIFSNNDTRQAWSYLKTIAEIKKNHTSFEPESKEFSNKLNTFYARFDT